MVISEAIMRLQQDARLFMVSPTGDLFEVNRTGGVYKVEGTKRVYARFKASDLVSQLWRVFTLEQLKDEQFMAAQG